MNKIDLIIENIEYAKLVKEQAYKDELLEEALAAARELSELKPVAWQYKGDLYGIYPCDWVSPDDSVTPLYALGDEK